jgi:transcriptional regulator with XRE-family HTH domain
MDRVFPYAFSMPTDGLPDDESSTASPIAQLLAANINLLMSHPSHTDLSSNPKLGKRTGLGASAISRIRSGHNTTIESLVKLADAFHLAPWQLLVHGMDPANPPVLLPVSPAEQKLYRRFKSLFTEGEET